MNKYYGPNESRAKRATRTPSPSGRYISKRTDEEKENIRNSQHIGRIAPLKSW